jgi:demethylmenaquinone methyltransferase/2-methoxy-6-polyprenyl-1,4-benzoquinol methylase
MKNTYKIDNIYSPEFVKDLFNRMSGSYERMNYITSFGFSIRWRTQFLMPFITTNEKIEVIDLLTGMGETWGAIRHKFPNANISALDFSEEMLKSAKSKSEKYYQSRINLIQENVLNSKLPSKHFDIVICAFGLKTFNAQQLKMLATEVKRILKDGGQFSFIEVSSPKNIVLKAFYGFYLKQVIPIIGKLLLGNPTEYKMLWKYTEKFVNAQEATEIFNSSGLEIKYNSYFYDCATGFSGRK